MNLHDIQSECDNWLRAFMGKLHQAYLQEFMVTPLDSLHIYKPICDKMCLETSLWKYPDIIIDENRFAMDALIRFWRNNTEVK